MTTVQEKNEKRIEEGFDAARSAIYQKVGESKMMTPSFSVYHQDLSSRAKRLLGSFEEIGEELANFLATKCAEPERKDQLDLKAEAEAEAEAEQVSEDVEVLGAGAEPPGRAPGEPAKRRGRAKVAE